MFSVPKYSKALDALRQERGIEGLFQHKLVSIDCTSRQALFADLQSDKKVVKVFDLLHVTPPQQALEVVATSPLADKASGFVTVDPATLQHTDFPNIFAIGDCAGLPTSKTAAAISSQAPVLVDNLLAVMEKKKPFSAYQGYSSCPLLTGHGELMLCEFKYGGEPSETFAPFLGSQDKPRRLFYHLKKDIFPPVYWRSFLKGSWFGRYAPNTCARDVAKAEVDAPETVRAFLDHAQYLSPTLRLKRSLVPCRVGHESRCIERLDACHLVEWSCQSSRLPCKARRQDDKDRGPRFAPLRLIPRPVPLSRARCLNRINEQSCIRCNGKAGTLVKVVASQRYRKIRLLVNKPELLR